MPSVQIPPDTVKLLDKILEKNPDFEDREFLLFYCVRRYYDDFAFKAKDLYM